MTLIGCTIDSLAVLDAQVGAKVPLRDYFWDKQNPSYVAGLAKDRPGIMSWKFRGAGTFPAKNFTAGKYDADFNAYLDDLLALGMLAPVAVTEHEVDAKTAATSGTPAELDAALLHASKLCRAHPLWKSSGAKVGVCLTGYDLVDRGPLFAAVLADCDVIVLDPYAGPASSEDSVAGPEIDWIVAKYPGKEIQLGEWGIPTGHPNRSQAVTDFVAVLNTPRYKALTAAYYWNGSGFLIMGTADQPALVAAIKASLTPPDPLQGQLNAALAQIVTLQAQLAAAVAQHAADQTAVTGLQSQLTAAQVQVTQLTGMVAAARTALGS